MECGYYDAGRCRSCTLMGVPYAVQLADKDAAARATLHDVIPARAWLAAYPSADRAFRNKAKLVAGGRAGRVTLGILDGRQHGVDLRRCGLHEDGLRAAIPRLARIVDRLGLVPYDVPARRGELKHVIVTHSPDGRLMVRFVLRSQQHVADVRGALPELSALGADVVSVNLLPEHVALLEGERETVLTESASLAMRLPSVTLHLRPRSFFQTNTAVSTALYAQATEWVETASPTSVLDLYCGVGGFALHAAAPGRTVRGVELSADSVRSAERSAAELRATRAGLGDIWFRAGDATDGGIDSGVGASLDTAGLVVVNPPRRGIGADLARRLDASPAGHVVYSSCNPVTLARDLAGMPHLRPVAARLFDMFPQTAHAEVLVLLERA